MIVHRTFLEHVLTLRAERIGRDLNVLCSGGSCEHIGGCALAVPYKKNAKGGTSASVSCLSAPGHQDSALASTIAKQLCKKYECVVCVQCGIHYENLSPQNLKRLQDHILDLCLRLEASEL
jgi:hypothetical protein